jgi:ParB family transcriptional regulator, chromosome partitioning protein
MTEAIVTDGG